MRLLPRKVTILSQTVHIRRVKNLKVVVGDGKLSDCWGAYQESGPYIELDQSPSNPMGHEKLRLTLVHETVHAMNQISGLDSMFEDGEVEERFTRRFSPLFLAFIRDNPNVVAFLQEKADA